MLRFAKALELFAQKNEDGPSYIQNILSVWIFGFFTTADNCQGVDFLV